MRTTWPATLMTATALKQTEQTTKQSQPRPKCQHEQKASANSDQPVTQQRGGPRPLQPPLARPLDNLPDSAWWMEDTHAHLALSRDGFWIHIVTNLPSRELRRFADTLSS